MKIRTLFLLLLLPVLLGLALGSALLWSWQTGEVAGRALTAQRERIHVLADELRFANEEMGRMAAAFIDSGDVRFQQFYEEIHAIQNGAAPRPQEYGSSYWYRVLAGGPRGKPGEALSIFARLRREGAPEAPVAALEAAFERREALASIEREAMAAMRGEFFNYREQRHFQAAADPQYARRLVHGMPYMREKVRAFEAIQRFQEQVDVLLGRQQAALAVRQLRLQQAMAGGMFLWLLGAAAFLAWGWRRLTAPLAELGQVLQRVGEGDFSVRCDEAGPAELRQLGGSFNRMVEAIENDLQALRELVLHLPIPMLVAEGEGDALHITQISQRFFDLLGTPDETLRVAVQGWVQLGHGIEARLACRSGENRAFAVHLNSVGTRHLLLLLDLTERHQAEEQILELGELNQLVIENAPSGILVCNVRGQTVMVNQAAASIIGASVEQLGALNLLESPVSRQSGLTELAQNTLETGQHNHFEGLLTTSFGRTLWASVELARIRLRGENLVLCVLEDLSSFKAAADALRDAKRAAESASRSKSEFLANMSHEIRTPMNAVIGLAQLALTTELTPKQQDYLEKIHQASKSLLGILNDLLDYSKIEAGKLDLEQVEFSLEEVLQRSGSLFLARAAEKGIEVVYAIDPQIPLRLVGDPLRLGQVLSNLIGNALKFTERGEIAVSMQIQAVDNEQLLIECAVRDTGIGISPEQMSRLFMPFSQADGSITRRYGGTGLGLAICQRLVELMGGKIEVDSAPGQGSTFRFTFACRAPAASCVVPPLHRLRILLVDDLESSRAALQQMLESWSYSVTTVASAEEALAGLQQAGDGYDLALIDLQMPQMDGVQLVREIRARGLDRRGHVTLRILLMDAAHDLETLQDLARGLGVGALAKPVTSSGLFDLLANQLWGEAQSGATERKPASIRLRQLEGARILVAEDNIINQQVVREFLTLAGLEVICVNNGQEALERLAREKVDAVLMDLHMPVLDGLAATRQIRSQPGWQTLPVLAMTAAVMQQDREDCLAAGMNDFVAKPIDPDNLLGILQRWVRTSIKTGRQPVSETGGEAFPDLPGFDMSRIHALLGGNFAFFRRLLAYFQRDFCGLESSLKQAIGQGDWAAACAMVHAVKGAAGNLGAVAVQGLARQLELELRERGDLPSLDAFLQALRQALALAVDYRQEEMPHAAAGADSAAQQTLIRKLGALLEAQELVPDELQQETAHSFAGQTALVERLLKALDVFDYATAKLVWKELAQQAAHTGGEGRS